MNYKIILKSPARKFIKKQDSHIKKRIIKSLKELEKNPRSGIPLTGNLRGLWEMRNGTYRIVYQIGQEEVVVYVLNINHRKKVYK